MRFLFHHKLVRFLNNIKLRNKLIISFSLLAIIPVVVVGEMSNYYSKKYLIESETNSLVQSMYQMNNSLDYFFQTYMDRTNMVFSSEDLQELIRIDASEIDIAVSMNKKMGKLLTYIESDFNYPEMDNHFGSDGGIISRIYLSNDTVTSYGIALPLESIMSESWVHELFKGPRAFLWHYGDTVKDISCVSLTRRLVNFDNARDAGLLQLFIPVSRVTKIINNNLKNDNMGVFYLDENSNKIAAAGNARYSGIYYLESIKKLNLKEGVNPVKIGNERIIVGSMTSKSTHWKVVYLIPLKSVTGKTEVIGVITLVTIIVALVLCIIIAFGLSTIITRRIKILLDKTNEIDENNLKTSLVVKGNDEISQLDKNFDRMILRIRNLIENVYKAQIITNKTKFELIQEQINPHLLYNTLSMVAATASQAGQDDIMVVADNLSAFYRGVLNRGKMVCSFREELDMVKRYAEIAEYVYKLDIDLLFDVEDDLLDFYTIKLLIQPVIENSILHGIRPKKAGTISISGNIENNDILLLISDDGIGMDENKLNQLNDATSKSEFDRSYGITNVGRRIKMLLGESYGLRYTSTQNEGTTVAISLPRLTSGEIDKLVRE